MNFYNEHKIKIKLFFFSNFILRLSIKCFYNKAHVNCFVFEDNSCDQSYNRIKELNNKKKE
jgi:hypothetical protein